MNSHDAANHFSVEPFIGEPDERGNPLDAVSPLDDQSWTVLCAQACAVNELAVIEVVAWLDRHRPSGEHIPAEQLDALRQLESIQRKAWHLLVAYQSNQHSSTKCPHCAARINTQQVSRDMRMSTRAMALELGYVTAAGADNIAELAQKMKMKKQTASKCAQTFQEKMKLPARPGQRSDEGCENMSNAVKKRLIKIKSAKPPKIPQPHL